MVRGLVTRVGRSPDNDLVIVGDEAVVVSSHHLEIHQDGEAYRLLDLNSTNGTYLNGARVSEAGLEAPAHIQLGLQGPEFAFVLEELPPEDLNQTLVGRPRVAAISNHDEQLLSGAVAQARRARRTGITDQTLIIMREVLRKALHRTGKKFKGVIAVLALAMITLSAYGYWRIAQLKNEKRKIDGQIQVIEGMLQKLSQDTSERARLIDQLNEYQDRAQALQQNLLYRLSARNHEEFVRHEIRTLMTEFGAEVYSLPPEFVDQVKRFIEQYQGPDRPNMERALGRARQELDTIRHVFQREHLPPDLGFMVLVESAFVSGQTSRAGAAGLWQFTSATARAYGLRVDDDLDERMDVQKATVAACKYIRELILEFGSGSSVMLALAAYNVGPGKVKQAVRSVTDPIKQRNFWYLYRVRALPAETRAYVPKVISAMIIGHNPERFGF